MQKQKEEKEKPKGIQGVLIAPTRELSQQLYREMEQLCDGLDINVFLFLFSFFFFFFLFLFSFSFSFSFFSSLSFSYLF